MDQQRGYPDDGDQRWYPAEPDWERGRHGAPQAPADEAYDPTARYQGQSLFDVGPRSGEPMPPRPGEPVAGEAARRSMEAIDVAALRRDQAPVYTEQPPAYAEPPPAYAEQPPGFAAPDYPGADYAGYPPGAGPASPVTGPPEQHGGGLEGLGFGGTAYPVSAPHATGAPHPVSAPHAAGVPHPASAPTAAHNTVGGTYRSRRPAVAIGVWAVAGLFEIAALRVLVDAVFTGSPAVGATAGAMFLVLGLPMFALGVHGLLGGAAANAGWRAWARPPLVYLPLGIVLFVCAALAA